VEAARLLFWHCFGEWFPSISRQNDLRTTGARGRFMKSSSVAKQTRLSHIYQMSSEEDYFYKHPNTVMLGFLGAVAVLLLVVTLALWIGYNIL
jgi:hypothetical protein